MFRAEHFELDVENRGNRLIGWIGAVLNVVARYIPEYPPPIPHAAEKAKRRMAMKQAKQAEPPSWFRPPVFMVGQNRRGNWVVRDQKGVCGGLFVSRDAALRFVRAENGYRPQAVVMVSGNLELDMTGGPGTLSRRETSIDLQRRIA